MANVVTHSLWQTRIANANKLYVDWESHFKCKTLEDYFRGNQWKGKKDFLTVNYNPYQLNLFYSTLKTKLASLLFQRPRYIVNPTPGNSDWNEDFAARSAQLKEDVLNAIISNQNMNFVKHCKRAARDSFFRFGIMEVGYAADWRNPQKDDPLLKSWNDGSVTDTQDKVIDENEVPISEQLFIKRINPRRFRVSISEEQDLNDHQWCGYYEFYYTKMLKNMDSINWPDKVDYSYLGADYTSGILADPHTSFGSPEFARLLLEGEVSKVWHIWDIVSHKELLLLDDRFDAPLWSADFERLPLVDIRWDEDFEGFYPIPPAYQWLSPQDEINEAREQVRSYRRRFTRKFQMVKGNVEPEEIEKFVSGPDGIIIEVKVANAISAIDNPEMGPTSENALIQAKDDFNVISGTSAEARGQMADRETATQSKLVQERAEIRENAEQLDFSIFMCLIGKEIIVQAQEKLVGGYWIKLTDNPPGGMAEQENQQLYQYITAQHLNDGYDFETQVDIQNATPAALAEQKQAFMSFVAMLQNYPMLATNPNLIRETAYRLNYRNERIISQFQQAAMAQMQAQQAAQGQGGGQGANNPNNVTQTQLAQQASPDLETTQNQIQNQLPVQ